MTPTDPAGALVDFDDWQDADAPGREALLARLTPAQRARLQALIAADHAAEAHGLSLIHISEPTRPY